MSVIPPPVAEFSPSTELGVCPNTLLCGAKKVQKGGLSEKRLGRSVAQSNFVI